MGSGGSHESDEGSGHDEESHQRKALATPVPEAIVISRKDFQNHMRGHAFASWEELVQSMPGATAPQGSSDTIVRCDPMQVFAWVATLLIQCCVWGLVAYFATFNAFAGIVVALIYGVVLWLAVERCMTPNMAGMVWPNLPVVVGAVGFLISMALLPNEEDSDGYPYVEHYASRILFFCIIPATVSAAVWMRKLPEDPDRAVLVTNLFLGVWAATGVLYIMAGGQDVRFNSWSLVFLSLAGIGAAVAFFLHPGRWGSVELVSWTLNVSSLGLGSGTCALLMMQTFENPAATFAAWVVYGAVHAALGALGLWLGRTLPLLMSAFALAVISIRASYAVSVLSGSELVGFCFFGVMGIVVLMAAQYLFKRPAGGPNLANRQVID